MPKIRADTLNNMAFFGFTHARTVTVPSAMDFLRNNFTTGSVRFRKASRRPGSVAMVGSVQEYMAVQELGRAAWEVGHVPTKDARISKNVGKRVSRAQRLKTSNWGAGTIVRGNRAAFIRIKQAQRSGDKGPFRMEIDGKHGKQEGLFRLKGTGPNALRMFHNVSITKVKITKRPWLAPIIPPTLAKGRLFAERNFNRFLKS